MTAETHVLNQPVAGEPLAGPRPSSLRAWLRVLPACLDGIAAAALALTPVWWHLSLVEPDDPSDVTAVFATVGIYPSDVCLALLALGGLVLIVTRRPRPGWALRPVALGIVALPIAALVSVLAASDQILAAGLAGHLALLGLAWFAVGLAPVSAGWLALGVVCSACLQAGLAIVQFATQQPVVPVSLGLPWLPNADVSIGGTPVVLDPNGDRLLRAFGTFPHPNVLGGYLALALVLLPLLASSRRRAWLSLPVGLLLGAGLLVSFSRAAWLAAAIGLVVWWLTTSGRRFFLAFRLGRAGRAGPPRPGVSASSRPWRILVVAGVLAVIAAVLLVSPVGGLIGVRLSPRPANDLERGSIEQRLSLDRSALSLIKRHPTLGVGAGNFGEASLEAGLQAIFGEPAHSVPLLIVAEMGIPGALAGLALTLGLLIVLRRNPAAVAGCCAVGVLMLLDHYAWTMALGRVIAWAPLAVVAAVGGRMAR
jgi:O-Antigen ligase